MDPATGYHTNRIESVWSGGKSLIIKHRRNVPVDLLQSHLAEYWWRTTIENDERYYFFSNFQIIILGILFNFW